MAASNPTEEIRVDYQCRVCWRMDKKKVLANYHCVSCPKTLCDKCKDEHKDSDLFSDHKIYVLLTDLDIRVKCQKHSDDNADYWCTKCRHPLCDDCAQRGHKGHTIISVKDNIQTLKTYHKSIPPVRDQLKQNLKVNSDKSEYLQQDFDKTVRIVENHRDKLIQDIRNKTKDLLRDLEQKHQTQQDELVKDNDKVTRIDRYLNKTSKILNISTESSFAEMEALLTESEQLSKCKCSVPDELKVFEFKPENTLNVGQIVEKSCPGVKSKVKSVVSSGVKKSPVVGGGVVQGAAARGPCQIWQGDVNSDNVWDMKFVSHDTLVCVQEKSISLYTDQGGAGSFRLLRHTRLDGHSLNCVAAVDASHIYLTCGRLGGCGTVHVYDTTTHRLFPHTGQWKDGMFQCPWGIAVSEKGIVAVADVVSRHVCLYRGDGSHVTTIDLPRCDDPCWLYVTWADSERLVVTDFRRHCIYVYVKGQLSVTLGTPGQQGGGDHQLALPRAVCINNNNNILVADTHNGRLSEFTCQGDFVGHPLTRLLDPITQPCYMDVVKQGDKWLLLVGDWDGKVKVFHM